MIIKSLKSALFLLIVMPFMYTVLPHNVRAEDQRYLALLSYNNYLVLLPWDGTNITAKPIKIENPLSSVWQYSDMLMPGNDQVIILDNKRKTLFSIPLNGATSTPSSIATTASLSSPAHMAHDPVGNRIFITNKEDDNITILTLSGQGFVPIGTIKGDLSGLRAPDLLAYDQKTGELAVYSSTTNTILYFDTNNKSITEPIRILRGFKTKITNPTYLAISSKHQLLLIGTKDSVIIFSTKAEGNVPPLFEMSIKDKEGNFNSDGFFEYDPEFYYDDEMSTLHKMSAGFTVHECTSGSILAYPCYIKIHIEQYAINDNKLSFVKKQSFDSDIRQNCVGDRLFCGFVMDTKKGRAVFGTKDNIIFTDGTTKQRMPLNKEVAIFNMPENIVYNPTTKDIMIGNIGDATFSYLSFNTAAPQPVFLKKIYYSGYLSANVFDLKHDLVITAREYGMTVSSYESIKNDQFDQNDYTKNQISFESMGKSAPQRPYTFEFSQTGDFLIVQDADYLWLYDHTGNDNKSWSLKGEKKLTELEFNENRKYAGSEYIALDDNAMELYLSLYSKNAIAVFSIDRERNLKLKRTIVGPETKLARPSQIAVDQKGKKLIVYNETSNNITVYELGASGNSAPLSIIKGGALGFEGLSAIKVIDRVLESRNANKVINSKTSNYPIWKLIFIAVGVIFVLLGVFLIVRAIKQRKINV